MSLARVLPCRFHQPSADDQALELAGALEQAQQSDVAVEVVSQQRCK